MKVLMIEIPYGTALIMPVELTGFIPSMKLVDVEGYGASRTLTAAPADRPLAFEFIESTGILPPKPTPAPPVPPAPVEAVPGTGTDDIAF